MTTQVPLLDPDGTPIPKGSEGQILFAADLCDFNDGKGPMLTVSIPTYFETGEGTYEGDGVVDAPLISVLDAYLADVRTTDGGDGLPVFVSWLRGYVGKLESVAGMTNNPTPLQDRMYVALMAAKSFIQPKVRQDVREMSVLAAVDAAIKDYQDHRTPPPGPAPQKMDWDAVTEIPGG